jgi:hypothetical protein
MCVARLAAGAPVATDRRDLSGPARRRLYAMTRPLFQESFAAPPRMRAAGAPASEESIVAAHHNIYIQRCEKPPSDRRAPRLAEYRDMSPDARRHAAAPGQSAGRRGL